MPRLRWPRWRAPVCALRVGCIASGLVLAPGCGDLPGNDPNVPDRQPASTILNLANAIVCPPAAPTTCVRTPSYDQDIAPLVARACLPCHARGGVAADRDLSTFANFVHLETTDFVQIEDCLMPPADAGPDAALALSDRTELLQWFVCGSPNN